MADEQTVWRAVHASAAKYGLDGRQMALLRLWASERMKDLPHVVFEARPELMMRRSFVTAIGVAARRIRRGEAAA